MKTLRLLMALVAALALYSCSDDNPTGSTDNNNSGTFTNKASGTLNGTQWTATSVVGTRNAISSIVAVTFVAYGAGGSTVTFGITNAGQSSFTVAEGTANQAGFNDGTKDFGKEESGSITIDAITEKGMRGSFNITAKTSVGETATATGTFEVAF